LKNIPLHLFTNVQNNKALEKLLREIPAYFDFAQHRLRREWQARVSSERSLVNSHLIPAAVKPQSGMTLKGWLGNTHYPNLAHFHAKFGKNDF